MSSSVSSAPRRTLLEWFAETLPVEVPRSRLASALAVDDGERWSDWLPRAAGVLGWHADSVVAAPRDVEGERDAWWVTRAPGDGERWLVVAGAPGEGSQASVLGPGAARAVGVDARDLSDALGLGGPADEVDWVRVAPALPLDPLRSPERGAPLSPFRRLRRWARLERRTLVAVVAYSTVIGAVSLALPLAVQSLVDVLAFARALQPLIVISAVVLLVLALAAALRVLEVTIVELLQRRMFADLARDLARRLPAARPDAGGRWGLTERINRFFDVVVAQKSASALLLGATEVVMSTLAGLVLLAFYHPYLLVFDLVLVASLGLVVFRMGVGGIPSAVEESHAKYEVAAWLESVARRQRRFVTADGAAWATARTDRLTIDWLHRRRDHFAVVLRQTVGLATVQALASASLLGLGGFLVWNGQLTLGQLVAAELVVTGVVAQLAKFGKHLESFYDLNASVEKIGMLVDLDTEATGGELPPSGDGGMAVTVEGVELHGARCDLRATPGERLAVRGLPQPARAGLADLLHGRRAPAERARVSLDGVAVAALAPRALRDRVALLGGDLPVGGTLEDNLVGGESAPGADAETLRALLERVGLGDLLGRLEDGLGTWIHPSGSPLGHGELVALEVARVAHARPRLVVVDGALDHVDEDQLERLSHVLAGDEAPWTLVVLTDRRDVASLCARRLAWTPDRGLVEEVAS